MALIKSIQLPSGITAEYHRISELNGVDFNVNKAALIVETYIDHAHRLAGNQSVMSRTFILSQTDGNFPDWEAGPLLPLCYGALKTTPEFENSIDG